MSTVVSGCQNQNYIEGSSELTRSSDNFIQNQQAPMNGFRDLRNQFRQQTRQSILQSLFSNRRQPPPSHQTILQLQQYDSLQYNTCLDTLLYQDDVSFAFKQLCENLLDLLPLQIDPGYRVSIVKILAILARQLEFPNGSEILAYLPQHQIPLLLQFKDISVLHFLELYLDMLRDQLDPSVALELYHLLTPQLSDSNKQYASLIAHCLYYIFQSMRQLMDRTTIEKSFLLLGTHLEDAAIRIILLADFHELDSEAISVAWERTQKAFIQNKSQRFQISEILRRMSPFYQPANVGWICDYLSQNPINTETVLNLLEILCYITLEGYDPRSQLIIESVTSRLTNHGNEDRVRCLVKYFYTLNDEIFELHEFPLDVYTQLRIHIGFE